MKLRLRQAVLLLLFAIFGKFAHAQCSLVMTINALDSIDCPGTASGGVFLNITGAQGTFTCVIDGTLTFNIASIQNAIAAGNHEVIVTDQMGCKDTVTFSLPDPPAINVMASSTAALCNGDNSGSVTGSATGGVPPYVYAWQSSLGGTVYNTATALNLYANSGASSYVLTVTDSKGCSKTINQTVGEPSPFVFNSSQDSVDCYGQANGLATIFVTGGTPGTGYTYKWDNGDITQTAAFLTAGFHSVTVTDAQNCKAVTLVQVLQPANFNASTVSTVKTDMKCAGVSTGAITITNITGGTSPYSFVWSGGQISPDGKMATLLGQGFSYVTVTDWHGCSAVKGEFITAPTPISINSTTVNENCSGSCDGAISLTVSGGTPNYSFAWPPSTPPVEDPINLCSGTYIVTVTDANQCTATETATVGSATVLNLTLAATNPKCSNSTDGSIQATASGGSGGFTFKWTVAGTTSSITNLGGGMYSCTATDANGCSKTATVTLTPPPALLVDSISIISGIKCFGDGNGALKANIKGGTGATTYVWNDPLAQTGQTASNLLAGSYKVTVTDANGCTATNMKVLSQPNLLASTATAVAVKCFGETSGSATAVPTGGSSPFTYKWSDPLGQTGVTATNLGVGSFSVTVIDKNGCTATASATVTGPTSAVDATATQTIKSCFGENKSEATATATGGNGAPFTFKWSNNATTATVTNLAAGSFTVTATDSKGCTDSFVLAVAENTAITINVVNTPAKCFGSTDGQAAVNIISGGAGTGQIADYNYNWSTTPPQLTAVATGLAGGQAYSVTATDQSGCTGTASTNIPSPLEIVLEMSVSSIKCFGGADGTASVVNALNAKAPVTYLWDNGQTTKTINALTANDYNVVITDANGCKADSTITIIEPAQLAIDNFVVKQIFCNGDTDGKAEAVPTGGTPTYSFLWSNGETGSGLRDLGAGWYYLTLTDMNGCSIQDSVEIAQPNPAYVILETTDVSCFGLKNGKILISTTGGAQPLMYSTDSIHFSGNSALLGLAAGYYPVYVKDANGCIFSNATAVNEPPKIEVELGPDVTITLGDSLTLIPSVVNGQGVLTYNWKPEYPGSTFCTDSTCLALLVKPANTIAIGLVLQDENGCTASDLVKITVDKERGLFVPTGFTPNDDLANDRLCVYGKSKTIKEVLLFRIFDRWGNLVFEDKNFPINDETRGWDGFFKGKEAQTGQYVWFVEAEYIDGFKQSAKGGTQLLR